MQGAKHGDRGPYTLRCGFMVRVSTQIVLFFDANDFRARKGSDPLRNNGVPKHPVE